MEAIEAMALIRAGTHEGNVVGSSFVFHAHDLTDHKLIQIDRLFQEWEVRPMTAEVGFEEAVRYLGTFAPCDNMSVHSTDDTKVLSFKDDRLLCNNCQYFNYNMIVRTKYLIPAASRQPI